LASRRILKETSVRPLGFLVIVEYADHEDEKFGI
jgi:hypothetical protein